MAEAGAASAPTVKMVTARRRIDTKLLPCQDLEVLTMTVEVRPAEILRGELRMASFPLKAGKKHPTFVQRSPSGRSAAPTRRERNGSPPWVPPATRGCVTLAISLPRVTPSLPSDFPGWRAFKQACAADASISALFATRAALPSRSASA